MPWRSLPTASPRRAHDQRGREPLRARYDPRSTRAKTYRPSRAVNPDDSTRPTPIRFAIRDYGE